ncbi:MAG: PLP-dependent cysteine synthase family protein [Myxococcota bacterium]
MLVDRIGNTPLVRLERIVDGLSSAVEVWAKLEWFNPGGSVKDRAAWSIIRDAEENGRILPGMRLLDSSSGNTGIAYGMIAATRGHQLTLCLPANANRERKKILRAYGVEVVETDPLEGSDGAIRAARALIEENPGKYLYLDQYGNDANWRAHYRSTAPEIWRDTRGRVSHWVAGLGTSGTFMGTSRRLKEYDPRIQCVSVEPDSPFHGLEGLKHMETAIVPRIYDATLADAALGAPTEASIALMRCLAREEGLLVGPSAAAACWGALQVARQIDAAGETGVVVTLFPDSGERYLSEDHLWA